MLGKLFTSLVLGLLASSSALAQATYEGCSDFRGQPVASVLDPSINDVAMAAIQMGQAVIRYNPGVLASMAEPTRRFFYMHECAHHALAHTVSNPSLSNERAADCWAIKMMRERMNLSIAELRAIQRDINAMARGDWTHLPGQMRAIDIEACLGRSDPSPRTGFPTGYGMQPCGCWGPNPAPIVSEPRCSSGSAAVNVCPAMCAPGHPAYAYVCQ